MKLNKDKQVGYDSNVVFDGYDAKIDEAQMHKLWDLLQDPYKNSIGAVVREYVSNSFDSHSEALFIKNSTLSEIRMEYSVYNDSSDAEIQELKDSLQAFDNDAVVVSIAKDESGWYWATEDFGVGLSPERVKDVFCSYLKSTKEDSNNVIGAFGIGSKSGLSYTDVIFIRTRYNGTESQYMLRKGEKSPRLDIVSNTPTTEMNGTQIKIYIKESKRDSYSASEAETWKFQEECVKQLAYFDNVYFNDEVHIRNDYTIAQGQNWIKSSNGTPFSGLHMCLGKVAYPIDWDQIDEEAIRLPVALKFEIGELDIIQTREDVKYTPRTKQAISDKINALKKELFDKWKSENEYQTDDLFEWVINVGSNPLLKYDINNWKFELWLSELFKHDDLPDWEFTPFSKIGFKLPSSVSWRVFIDYYIPSYVNDTGLKHANYDIKDRINGKYPIYRIQGNHETKKSKYICHEVEQNTFYLLRKKAPSLKKYKEYLKLKDYPKSEWRTIIKTYQKEVQNCLVKYSKSYAKVNIDSEWLKAQRKNSTRAYDNTIFNTYQFTNSYSYSGAWKSVKLKKGEVDKNKSTLYIAGLKEHCELLLDIGNAYAKIHKNLHTSYDCSKYMKILYVAKNNAKYIQDAPNLISIDNYMEQKLFTRACTEYYIRSNSKYELLGELRDCSGDVETMTEAVNKKLHSCFCEVHQYMKNNNLDLSDTNAFFKDVYEHALENDLLDKDIIAKADYIVDYLKDIPLLNRVNWYSMTAQDLAIAIYRFNKGVGVEKIKKMNPNYYVNLNETELSWLNDTEQELYTKCRLL